MGDYMGSWVTPPPKPVASPTWGPPLPCKQALKSTERIVYGEQECVAHWGRRGALACHQYHQGLDSVGGVLCGLGLLLVPDQGHSDVPLSSKTNSCHAKCLSIPDSSTTRV